MYSTCLHCTRDLGRNDILEELPIGRRIAFDAAEGRLWVVCRSCAKWNLVPFDNRLEAIDACERVFRDTRKRFSTDQIGLARARDGMDLVRIGAPQLPEFASWRYGSQYRRRRRRTIVLAGVGAVATVSLLMGLKSLGLLWSGAASVTTGWQVARIGWNGVRERRRRIRTMLPDSKGGTSLKAVDLQSAHIDWSDGELQLALHSPAREHATVNFSGSDGRLLMRRVAGALNDVAGAPGHLSDAVARLESRPVEHWLREIAGRGIVTKRDEGMFAVFKDAPPEQRWKEFSSQSFRLAALEPGDRLAVEMWLSEEDEAKALAGELKLLERQWREADELAKIADSLAVSDDVDRQVGGAK